MEPYVRRPMQCFNCLEYSHTSKSCKNDKKCIMCGEMDHQGKPCDSKEPRCANCKENHESIDRKCPIYEKWNQVNVLMAHLNLSFIEAKDRIFGKIKPPTNTKENFPDLTKKSWNNKNKKIISDYKINNKLLSIHSADVSSHAPAPVPVVAPENLLTPSNEKSFQNKENVYVSTDWDENHLDMDSSYSFAIIDDDSSTKESTHSHKIESMKTYQNKNNNKKVNKKIEKKDNNALNINKDTLNKNMFLKNSNSNFLKSSSGVCDSSDPVTSFADTTTKLSQRISIKKNNS